MNPIVAKLSREQLKKEVASFGVGDSVRVHTKVVESGKERVQIFAGVVIARRGSGVQECFTVRRISYGEGVERVFPLHSPRIDKVEVEHQGRVRRAKLYYIRHRVGKGAMKVKDKLSTISAPTKPKVSKPKKVASKEKSVAA